MGYVLLKMKRKDVEEVNDEFSDFSLSPPARKIRRLDAELPPIMEEEESESRLAFEQLMPQELLQSNLEQVGDSVNGEKFSDTVNEERAIALFKPMNTQLLQSPSNFSVSVSSDIISGFKNQALWSSQSNPVKSVEDEAATREKSSGSANECLAVVPWVPSWLAPTLAEISQTEVLEMMEAEGMDLEMIEAEEMDATTKEIEVDNVGFEPGQKNVLGGMSASESLHQWQQQHCMIPQLPQNTSTPIAGYR